MTKACFVPLVGLFLLKICSGFVAKSFTSFSSPCFNNRDRSQHKSCQLLAKATLDEETTWRLSFVLGGVQTEKKRSVDEIFVAEAKFIEEPGYEPPQGVVQIASNDSRLKFSKTRWTLSEDPDDRKDGLWIWGLFQEPLYPFMLLSLETEEIPLGGDTDDCIKGLKLFAQINHKRDDEEGVTLSNAELKIREIETLKADPFGAATVDVFEELGVGQLNIQRL